MNNYCILNNKLFYINEKCDSNLFYYCTDVLTLSATIINSNYSKILGNYSQLLFKNTNNDYKKNYKLINIENDYSFLINTNNKNISFFIWEIFNFSDDLIPFKIISNEKFDVTNSTFFQPLLNVLQKNFKNSEYLIYPYLVEITNTNNFEYHLYVNFKD